MAVFRIHKSKDFTVMSNHHLRNKELSLKAKGLLTLMLSLPEDWDYSSDGLALLSSDGLSSVKSGLQELEAYKYLVRTQAMAANGTFAGYNYDIYETPYEENPSTEKPSAENPSTDNPPQYNTNINSTYRQSTNILNEDNSSRIMNNTSKNISSGSKEKQKKGLDLSFVGIEYLGIMEKWIEYHKAIGHPYKQVSIRSIYEQLLKLSNGDARVADQIVEQSIANGWQGLFELKQSKQQSYGNSSNTAPRNPWCDVADAITKAGGIL